jgi:hypothetical protein
MSSSASSPVPGLVWSNGPLAILRVSARRATDDDHFILLRNLVPIGPPTFSTCSGAIRYAEAEWLGVQVVA